MCGTPGSRLEEIWALGLQAREQEEWQDAAEAFDFVLFAPGFSRAAEARLLLAEVQYRDGRYIEARSEYQRVIEGVTLGRLTRLRSRPHSGSAAH